MLTIISSDSFSQGYQKPSPSGGPPTAIPKEIVKELQSHMGLIYATYGKRQLKLDLYRPKQQADSRLPAIVCIHGGGWWQGNRKNHQKLAQAIASHGFVAVTISYRLSGEAPFPAAIHDCKAAVRFLRANAKQYGINPTAIGATGLSAGGHLTALLATSSGVTELEGNGGHDSFSSAIQAAVPMGAQTNFRSHFGNIKRTPPTKPGEKPNIWVQFMDGTPEEVPQRYDLASPITHLTADDPPTLFITGEHDKDSTHAELFRNRMKQMNIAEKLVVVPDAPHPFLGRQKFFDQAIEETTQWFQRHLKP